jgi:hypothetical protein
VLPSASRRSQLLAPLAIAAVPGAVAYGIVRAVKVMVGVGKRARR